MDPEATHRLFVAFCAFGSVALFVWWVHASYRELMSTANITEERRSAIGNFLLVLIAPFASVAAQWIGPRLDRMEERSHETGHTPVLVMLRRKAESMLVGAGRPHELSANEFLGMCLIVRAILLASGLLVYAMLAPYVDGIPTVLIVPFVLVVAVLPEIVGLYLIAGIAVMVLSVGYYAWAAARWPGPLPLLLLVFLALGVLLPWVWLRDCERRRKRSIRRDLPYALDLLTLAVEAGLDFTAALARIIRRRPDTALSQELAETLRQIQMGVPRSDALRNLSERVVMEEVFGVTSALIQADELGASLGPTLRIQADYFRVRRAQAAEKAAMEAPVKLLFPLLIFFFPATFIVLFGPVFLQFMMGGY